MARVTTRTPDEEVVPAPSLADSPRPTLAPPEVPAEAIPPTPEPVDPAAPVDSGVRTAAAPAASKGSIRPEVADYLGKKYGTGDDIRAALKASLEAGENARKRHSFDRLMAAQAWRPYDPNAGLKDIEAERTAPLQALGAGSAAQLATSRGEEMGARASLEARKQEKSEAMDDPNSEISKSVQALLPQMMPGIHPEAVASATASMFPELSKYAQAQMAAKEAAAGHKATAEIMAGGRTDAAQIHADTMAQLNAQRAADRAQADADRKQHQQELMETKQTTQDNKDLTEASTAINQFRGRFSNTVKNAARLQAGERLRALITDDKGNINPLSPQQIPEMAMSLAQLITSGNMVTEGTIKSLIPKTFKGTTAQWLQYVTNKPEDSGVQKFAQQALNTILREEKVVGNQVRQGLLSEVAGRMHLRKNERTRDSFHAILKNEGLDPDAIADDGTLKPGKTLADLEYKPQGGGGASAAPTGPTHYKYSADRKMRIPSDAQGNELGPPEPSP